MPVPDRADGQLNGEDGALSFTGTGSGGDSSVQLDQRFHNGEAHAQTAFGSRDGTIRLRKPVEDQWQEFRFDTRSIVAHAKLDLRLHTPQFDLHQSRLRCKSDGVGKQIPNHLLETFEVSENWANAGIEQRLGLNAF